MVTIFADLSTEALSRVSEDHYIDSFKCFSVAPGIEVYEAKDLIRVVSPGIPNWLTNVVLRCRLPADSTESVIDETNDYFHSRGVVPYWQLLPSDQPSDLGERLAKKGLSLTERRPAMAIDLEQLNRNINPPNHLKIERVTDTEMLRGRHGWIRQLGEGKTLGTLLLDVWNAYGFGEESDWQTYIGMRDGKPVSWASAFYATGVVGIYAVGTVPEARRQGIGSAMTLHALLEARNRGYRVGMLQSSELGYSVYRRLGFQTCFEIKIYNSNIP